MGPSLVARAGQEAEEMVKETGVTKCNETLLKLNDHREGGSKGAGLGELMGNSCCTCHRYRTALNSLSGPLYSVEDSGQGCPANKRVEYGLG